MSTKFDDETLDALRHVGDPVGDDVVAAYFANRDDPSALVGVLARDGDPGPDTVPELAHYLADRPPLPDWACDTTLAQRAESFFAEWGLAVGGVLYTIAFPAGYAGWKGSQVLHLTGRLETEPNRRVIETAQLVHDVFVPNGLQPGNRAWMECRKVRLMHAAVRWLVDHDPRVVHNGCDPMLLLPQWSPEWGVPVNQEDLLGFMLVLSVEAIDVMRRIGVPLDDETAAAYLHQWCVVGHLLGIRDDLLPIGLDDARALWTRIQARNYGASAAGQALTAAAVSMLRQIVGPHLRWLPPAGMRHFLGADVAKLLDVPRSVVGQIVFGPLRRLTEVLGVSERHDRLVRYGFEQLGRGIITTFLRVEDHGRPATFSIPDQLATRWQLTPTAPR
jgi:hypothetical protein